jgi:hypothetical protein
LYRRIWKRNETGTRLFCSSAGFGKQLIASPFPLESARDPRLEVIDHFPEAVDLATFDDFEGLEPSERVIRRVEPVADFLGPDDLGELRLEPLGLADAPEPRFVGLPSRLPRRDGALGEASQPREDLTSELELPPDLLTKKRSWKSSRLARSHGLRENSCERGVIIPVPGCYEVSR